MGQEIISLYEHESTFTLHKLNAYFIAFLAVLFVPGDFMQYLLGFK